MASKEKFVEPMKKSYSVKMETGKNRICVTRRDTNLCVWGMWWIGTPARSRVPEKESALR